MQEFFVGKDEESVVIIAALSKNVFAFLVFDHADFVGLELDTLAAFHDHLIKRWDKDLILLQCESV